MGNETFYWDGLTLPKDFVRSSTTALKERGDLLHNGNGVEEGFLSVRHLRYVSLNLQWSG